MAEEKTLRLAIDATGMRHGARVAAEATEKVKHGATSASSSVRTLDKRMDAAGKTGSRIRGMLGGVFAGLGAAMAIRSLGTINAGFEETMLTIRAVTRANEQEMSRLEKTARSLGATTRYTAAQSAEALLYFARAGKSVDEAIAAVPHTLHLASAGALDLASAADITVSALGQFNLQATETQRVVDALAAGSTRGNTTIQEMGEALKYAGALSATAGADIETVSAALATAANRSIKASEAGTQFRGAMLALTAPTDKAKKAIRAMQLDIERLNPETNDLVDVFKHLGEGFERAADDNEVLRRANDIFMRRNANLAVILAQNADLWEENREGINAATGVTQEMSELIEGGLSGAFRSLVSALQETMLQLGDSGFTGGMRDVIQSATEAIRVIGNVNDETQEVSVESEVLAGAMKTVAVTMGLIVGSRLVAYLSRATIAMAGFNTAASANPMMALVSAGSALFAVLTQLGPALERTRQRVEGVKNEVLGLEDAIDEMRSIDARIQLYLDMGRSDKAIDELRSKVRLLESETARFIKIQQAAQREVDPIDISKQFVGIDELSGLISKGLINEKELTDSLIRSIAESAASAEQPLRTLLHRLFSVDDAPLKANLELVADTVQRTFTVSTAEAGLSQLEDYTQRIFYGVLESATLEAIQEYQSKTYPAQANIEIEGGDSAAKFLEFFQQGDIGAIADLFSLKMANVADVVQLLKKELADLNNELPIPDPFEDMGSDVSSSIEGLEGLSGAAITAKDEFDALVASIDAQADAALAHIGVMNGEIVALESIENAQERNNVLRQAEKILRKGEIEDTEAYIEMLTRVLNILFQNRAAAEDLTKAREAEVTAAGVITDLERELALTNEQNEVKRAMLNIEYMLADAYKDTIAAVDPDLLARAKELIAAIYSANTPTDEVQDYIATLREQIVVQQLLNEGEDEALMRYEARHILAKAEAGDVETITNLLRTLNEERQKGQQVEEKAAQSVDMFAMTLENNLSNALADTIMQARSAQDALAGLIQTLLRAYLQAKIIQPFLQSVGLGAPTTNAHGNIISRGAVVPFADGGVLSAGTSPAGSGITPFASGGVVGGPMAFPMAGGNYGLMGEAGPEAIMPLKRGSDGKLGVKAEGAGPQKVVNVNVQFHVKDYDSFRQSRRQFMADIKRASGGV